MDQVIVKNNRAKLNQVPQPVQMIEPLHQFLDKLKSKMLQVYHLRGDINQYAQHRGLPPFVLREIMTINPLAIGIPKEYGGRGSLAHENLALLETASYESLALSLTFGINSALFLQPVAKYALDEAKAPVFKRFLEERVMGGLMITEPDFGSDALSMQTYFTEEQNYYQLNGKKHWAGLTGWAEYWLLTARKR